MATPASAYPTATVSIEGHGYGPGDGMGQWGALGYALDGAGYQPILDHFYGGTSLAGLSAVQDATTVRVAMTENNGNTVIVTSGTAFSVPGTSIDLGPGQAVLMTPVGRSWNLAIGTGCGGPWSGVASGVANPTAVPDTDPAPGDPNTASEALQLCQIGGNLTLRGSIEATYNSDGAPRTVNALPLEWYVSGVVPNESPAGWGVIGSAGPQGQAWGFQELEAQAVATRSYVMAGLGSYGGYADTCDLDCQTYRGTLNESAVTDLAASATAGQVMEFPGGSVAATQYSSSTGGYTNPGTFPGVPDAGDAVCVPGACNPNHTWTATVAVATIEATWPQLGTLGSISITGRNGDGEWGGRVTAMTLVGSSPERLADRGPIRRRPRAEVGLVHHQHDPGQPGGGHGGHPRRQGLLGGGRQRWRGCLRRRHLRGLGRRPESGPPGGGDGRHPRRRRLLVGGLRRRRLHLRRRRLLRVDRQHRAQQAGGGHGRHPRRRRLLAGGLRRRHLRLRRRRLLRLDGRAPASTSRWWAWPPPPTAAATGWWPPTAASSPSATPPSTARWAATPSTSRWWAWPPPPTAAATGWWPPTAASSPSATPPSTGRPATSRSTSRWWAWPPAPGAGLLAGGVRRRDLRLRGRALLRLGRRVVRRAR